MSRCFPFSMFCNASESFLKQKQIINLGNKAISKLWRKNYLCFPWMVTMNNWVLALVKYSYQNQFKSYWHEVNINLNLMTQHLPSFLGPRILGNSQEHALESKHHLSSFLLTLKDENVCEKPSAIRFHKILGKCGKCYKKITPSIRYIAAPSDACWCVKNSL